MLTDEEDGDREGEALRGGYCEEGLSLFNSVKSRHLKALEEYGTTALQSFRTLYIHTLDRGVHVKILS